MAAERRRSELILAVALLLLAVAAYRLWPSPSAATPLASNQGITAPATPVAPERPAADAAKAGEPSASPLPAEREIVAAEPAPTPTPSPAPPGRAAQAAAGRGQSAVMEAPSVHLNDLEADRPKPVAAERNLFRFKEKPAPPAAVVRPPVEREDAAAPPSPSAPAGPPPAPQITLKYIGLVEQEGRAPKIAVLADSAGHVSYGREGDIIDGRYRILKIGAESLDIAYLDGTGRRTVRLSGS